MILTFQALGSVQDKFKDIIIIFICSLIFFIFLIANPSYYSHDELQKLDYVSRYGLIDYISQYVTIKQGDAFGTPVRPFSFFIQGLLALFMDSYPVIVHLCAVTIHAVVACLVYILVLQFGGGRYIALSSALIFMMNPLVVIATGWSAALMDRWYLLFGLLTLIMAKKYVDGKCRTTMLIYVFLFSSLSILSKETAVILPSLMLLFLFFEFNIIKSKRYWVVTGIWIMPILIFMIYRLPALFASFGNPHVNAYKASVSNIPEGLLIYFSYPFVYSLTEAQNWIFVDDYVILLSSFFHLLIIFAVFRVFGYKSILAYLFMYLVFLIPVLLIPIKASHYMYGSSIALSVGVAVLINQVRVKLFYMTIGFFAIGLLFVHSLFLQQFVYSVGTCMNRAIISTESVYLSHNKPSALDFQAEPEAPEHILYRINTGRYQVSSWFPVNLTISKWGQPSPQNSLSLVMNRECIVSAR